jgi:hypothetical protein
MQRTAEGSLKLIRAFSLVIVCRYAILTRMKKIATYIAEQQYVRLKALAQRTGVTQAELFRRFLEEGLARAERQPRPPAPAAEAPFERE